MCYFMQCTLKQITLKYLYSVKSYSQNRSGAQWWCNTTPNIKGIARLTAWNEVHHGSDSWPPPPGDANFSETTARLSDPLRSPLCNNFLCRNLHWENSNFLNTQYIVRLCVITTHYLHTCWNTQFIPLLIEFFHTPRTAMYHVHACGSVLFLLII